MPLEQRSITGGLPPAEIVRCLNNHHDQLEICLEKILILESRLHKLESKND